MSNFPRGQELRPAPKPTPPRTGTWYEVYVNWPDGPGGTTECETLSQAEDAADDCRKRGFATGKTPLRTEEIVILEVSVRQIHRKKPERDA
jgi:hypothetical protein